MSDLHLTIGRDLLAADAAENRVDMRNLTDAQLADWLQAHRRFHCEAAEHRIRYHGLLEIDLPDFLDRMRCAQVEAGMLHAEEPGECDDWHRVETAIEDLVSALDQAHAADTRRRVEREKAT